LQEQNSSGNKTVKEGRLFGTFLPGTINYNNTGSASSVEIPLNAHMTNSLRISDAFTNTIVGLNTGTSLRHPKDVNGVDGLNLVWPVGHLITLWNDSGRDIVLLHENVGATGKFSFLNGENILLKDNTSVTFIYQMIADVKTFIQVDTTTKRKQGTTSQRPTLVVNGFNYFDTDLGKPIWYKLSTTQWVDATGAVV
jgi:hypothetical protein